MIGSLLVLISSFIFQQSLPGAEEILDRVERTIQGVEDYTVTLEGEVSMEGIRVPKAVIEMKVKRPDKVHFSSQSFGMIPRDGMTPDPSALRRTYEAQTVGQFDTAGTRWYRLLLSAKDPETRLRQAYLYVDAGTWTIRRLESTPYQGRTISFDFEYELVDATYLLPSRVTAIFGSVGPETDEIFRMPADAPSPAPQMRDSRRSIRSGTVRFDYKKYRVNTGLPDSIFVNPGF